MKKKELISRGFTKRMSLEERALALKEGREQRLKELQEFLDEVPSTPSKPKRRRIGSGTMVRVTLFPTSSRPLVSVMTLAEATEHGYYSYQIIEV